MFSHLTMNKKDLIINIFLGGLSIFWSVFLAKIVIYHGLGYMGQTGGFKLDAVVISSIVILNIVIVSIIAFFNKKK